MSTTALSIITGLVPGLGSEVTDYISGLFDDDSEDSASSDESEDSLREFVRPLLECQGIKEDDISTAIEQIHLKLERKYGARNNGAGGPSSSRNQAKRLEKAIDMKSNTAISFAATLTTGPVDIESTTKGRNTQVDLKKLEKAEAKIKAKMEKRARRTVEFEGSKLVDAAKAQRA